MINGEKKYIVDSAFDPSDISTLARDIVPAYLCLTHQLKVCYVIITEYFVQYALNNYLTDAA